MSHRSYTPKHVAPRPTGSGRAAVRASARRTTLIASSVAVAATGAAVGAGLLVSPVETMASVSAADASPLSVNVAPAADRETRDDTVSRSAERRAERQEKREARQERQERQEPWKGNPQPWGEPHEWKSSNGNCCRLYGK